MPFVYTLNAYNYSYINYFTTVRSNISQQLVSTNNTRTIKLIKRPTNSIKLVLCDSVPHIIYFII